MIHFEGSKLYHLRSIAIIARIRVMIVVIALAKTDEGDQPTIAAAVLPAMGLSAHHVTERIDCKGGVQDHEHSEEATQKKAADSALPAAVQDDQGQTGAEGPRPQSSQ